MERERRKERRQEILFSWSFHGGRVNSKISLPRILERRKKRERWDERERGKEVPESRRKRGERLEAATKLSSTKASSPITPKRVVDSAMRSRVIRSGDVGDHEHGNYHCESIPAYSPRGSPSISARQTQPRSLRKTIQCIWLLLCRSCSFRSRRTFFRFYLPRCVST